jgi:GNAT superfamily N-acetyltransferase
VDVRCVTEPAERSRLARSILDALPGWFGLATATDAYVRDAAELETWAVGDEAFLCLRRHTAYAAEIHVMGVLPDRHRHGLGRALVRAALAALAADGVELLQVKTLAGTHPSERYARTRRFYEALGFRPFELLPELWGPENPCLVLVRRVALPLP